MAAQPLWGMPIPGPRNYTAGELLMLPEDGSKYELYQGVLVKMPPPEEYHGNIESQVLFFLLAYLRGIGKKNLISTNAGFDLTIPGQRDTVLAPDIAIAQAPVKRGSGYRKLPPLLAVEIASPSQFRPEMHLKAQFYLSSGVKLVWIIWPAAQTVDVWTTPDTMMTLQKTDMLDGGEILPGFTCLVAECFPEP